MRKLLLLIFLLPALNFSQKSNDSLKVIENEKEIKILKNSINEIREKYDYQVRINEQTLNSISNQISATSYNLSIFAFLFGLLAIGLGVYVTWVERKIIKLRDENESLLKQTKQTKNEVVAINELIQKDIFGLFIKIKREETTYILNRLVNIPEDISNLSQELLSRELEQEDYNQLKKAYLKLKSKPPKNKNQGFLSGSVDYKTSYLLLFFQHFLDLSLKDDEINSDLVGCYSHAIRCSFENDIVKSTEDFAKSLIDLGYQSKEKEINSFFKGIGQSKFKNLTKIYEIIYNSLKTRDDRFKFYSLLENDKQLKVPKVNFGNLLISEYGKTELTESEKDIIEEVESVSKELLSEKAKG